MLRSGLWVTGKRVEGSWAHKNEDSTFYELSAYVENILRRIGLKPGMTVRKKSENDIFSSHHREPWWKETRGDGYHHEEVAEAVRPRQSCILCRDELDGTDEGDQEERGALYRDI